MPSHPVVLLNSEEGRALVKRKCQEAGIKFSAMEELIAAEFDQQGKKRKKGLWEEFDRILDEIDEEGDGS